jgi:uroporphyrinogen-III synthase
VQQSGEVGWASVRTAALGPTTAAALREAGWPPEAVAREPTPEALADALAKCE